MKRVIFFLICLIIGLSSCSDNNSNVYPKDFKENRNLFYETLDLFGESNNISANLTEEVDTNNPGIEKKMLELMQQGIDNSKKISDEFLNYLHPELADNFRNKLVKSNELYLDGFKHQFDDANNSIAKQLKANLLLSEWSTFLNNNLDVIDKNLKMKKSFTQKIHSITKVNQSNLSYWRMFLRFVISDITIIVIFSLLVFIFLMPLMPIALLGERLNPAVAGIITAPFLIILYFGQLYVWLLWAAYSAKTVQIFTENPSVNHSWIYYITGFIFTSAPIGWFTRAEINSRQSFEEKEHVKRGGSYMGLTAILGFVLFSIWDSLMEFKFVSWLNEIIF